MVRMVWPKGSTATTKINWKKGNVFSLLHLLLLLLLLLCLTRVQVYADYLHDPTCQIGEGFCDFNKYIDDCPWENITGWKIHQQFGTSIVYAGLINDHKGLFETREWCRVAEEHHCVQFKYFMSNPQSWLSVYLLDLKNDSYLMWNVSSPKVYEWYNATVTISGITHRGARLSNFKIQIEGTKADNSDSVIGIDDLRYLQRPCPLLTTTTTTITATAATTAAVTTTAPILTNTMHSSTSSSEDGDEEEEDDDDSDILIPAVISSGIGAVLVLVIGVALCCCTAGRRRRNRRKAPHRSNTDDHYPSRCSSGAPMSGRARATDTSSPPPPVRVHSPLSRPPLSWHSEEQGSHYHTIPDSAILGNVSSVSSRLGGSNEEYNHLELTRNPQANVARSEEGGKVYDCLHASGAEVYNQVQRNRKQEVVTGAMYSRVLR